MKGDTMRKRRDFMRDLGIAVLTVQSLPLITHASGIVTLGDTPDEDLIIHSGPGLISHVHDLLIPHALLKAPPRQGVSLKTTQSLWHRHDIGLSREQLITVANGGTVTTKASSHVFTIAMKT